MDYYPFGMMMPDRQYYDSNDSSGYRLGFNGQEKDNEVSGVGNSLDFGARIYDPRLGKWLSVDPLWISYPSHVPYAFAINLPTTVIDIAGESVRFINGFRAKYLKAFRRNKEIPSFVVILNKFANAEGDFMKKKNPGILSHLNLEFSDGTGGDTYAMGLIQIFILDKNGEKILFDKN